MCHTMRNVPQITYIVGHTSVDLSCSSSSDPRSDARMGTTTNSLTPMLLVANFVKKFPACYETRRFFTMISRTCHWTLSSANWIQFTFLLLITERHDRVVILTCFRGFPQPVQDSTLKLGRDRFLPNPFLFIFHLLPISRRYVVLATENTS
jgi:hypothetical protein